MNVTEFVNHARAIHDITVAVERIVEDGLKVTPRRIVQRTCLTIKDIEAYWVEVVNITEEVEAKYNFNNG